jgi:hypothetical protein
MPAAHVTMVISDQTVLSCRNRTTAVGHLNVGPRSTPEKGKARGAVDGYGNSAVSRPPARRQPNA